VIGRSFPAKLIAAVSAAEVDDALDALCARELLQATEPDGYRFWHPLTQEVAAGTLLAARRSAIHAAVARVLVDAEPNRLDENSALIAAHFEAAGDAWEAAQWTARAADYAYRYDMAEAMRRWRATLARLEPAEHDDARRLSLRAAARVIRLGSRTGIDDGELSHLLDRGRSLAERLDDRRADLEMAVAAGTSLFWRGRLAEGTDQYIRAAALAESTGDPEFMGLIMGATGVFHAWVGPIGVGLEYVDRALEVTGGDARLGASVYGYGALGVTLMVRALLLRLAGDSTAARANADEATRILRQRSELEWLGWNLSTYADLAECSEEYEAGLTSATEALRIADESANPSNLIIALRAQGISLNGLGRFDEAAAALTEGLTEARARKVALFDEAVLLNHLALAYLGAGRLPEAAAAAEEAVQIALRQGAAVVECHAHLVRARLGRASDAPADDVVRDVAAGLELAARTGAVVYQAALHSLSSSSS